MISVWFFRLVFCGCVKQFPCESLSIHSSTRTLVCKLKLETGCSGRLRGLREDAWSGEDGGWEGDAGDGLVERKKLR